MFFKILLVQKLINREHNEIGKKEKESIVLFCKRPSVIVTIFRNNEQSLGPPLGTILLGHAVHLQSFIEPCFDNGLEMVPKKETGEVNHSAQYLTQRMNTDQRRDIY